MSLGDYMLGDLIRYMRKSRGITQEELSSKIYISTSTLSHYETGSRLVPYHTFLLIAKICEYKVNVIDLISKKTVTDQDLARVISH